MLYNQKYDVEIYKKKQEINNFKLSNNLYTYLNLIHLDDYHTNDPTFDQTVILKIKKKYE